MTCPRVIEEMQAIGTVEASVRDIDDFVAAISSGEANRRIKAPDSLQHRYYREDFGHGLLPFTALAAIAGVDVPVAASLLRIGAESRLASILPPMAAPPSGWALRGWTGTAY